MRAKLEEWCDRAAGDWEVNKVTYKTPDYMLCSAQDYHPGEKGVQQHIWQATLGPDAVVFVTHPPCLSEENSHRPGFWHGNVVLPRVAQWKDVLIAVHKLPEDDWLGFTHAYFPAWAFDEHVLRDAAGARRAMGLCTQGRRLPGAHGGREAWNSSRGATTPTASCAPAGRTTSGCATWGAPRSMATSPRFRTRSWRSM